jgi:hypothetical protein
MKKVLPLILILTMSFLASAQRYKLEFGFTSFSFSSGGYAEEFSETSLYSNLGEIDFGSIRNGYKIFNGEIPENIYFEATGDHIISEYGNEVSRRRTTYQIELMPVLKCQEVVMTTGGYAGMTLYYKITPFINVPTISSSIACTNESVTVSANVGFQNYIWEVFDGNIYRQFSTTNTNSTSFNLRDVFPSDYNTRVGQPLYFRVRTSNDCSVYSSLSNSITFYPAIPTQATFTPSHPLCSGSTGSITLSNFRLSDGTSYDASSGQLYAILGNDANEQGPVLQITSNSLTIDNLTPGNWNVRLQNAAGTCMADLGMVTINAAPPPVTVSSPFITPSTCFGQAATVAATAASGNGGYTYILKRVDGTIISSNSIGSFSIATADTYYIEAVDSRGCSPARTSNFTINIPLPISFTATSAEPSGYGLEDGSITITANGGTGSYEYQLPGVRDWQSSNTFNNLPAGTYQVQVRTSSACESNLQSVVINQPPPLSVSIAATTSVACYGESNGQFRALASGGTNTGYQYSLTNSFPSGNTTGVFTNLPAGVYTVYSIDSKGNTAFTLTTIAEPAVVSVTAGKTDVSCFNGTNGSIVLSGSGGTLPYTYAINGSAYQAGGTFNDLSVGVYSIAIQDNNGCTASGTPVVVMEPTELLLTAVQKEVLCNGGATGEITLSASGGTAPYQYSINNGATLLATPTFTSLTAGSYNAVIRDAAGCIKTAVITITEPAALQLTIDNITHAPCFEASGSIAVSSNGGTGAVTYSATPALTYTVGTYTAVKAGMYTLTATDDNGCRSEVVTTITQPDKLLVTSAVSVVSCKGGSDGKVVLTAIGGPNLPAEYRVVSGTVVHTDLSSNTFEGLVAGTYTFSVKRGTCETLHTVVVDEPAALLLEGRETQRVSTFGGNDGSFELTASGGNGGYLYTVNGVVKGSQAAYTNVIAGPYQVRATDIKGCTREIFVVVTEPNMLVLNLAAKKDVSCHNAGDGQVEVAGEGGNGGYTYSIDGVSYQASGRFDKLPGGNYLLTVKDAKGYLGYLPVTIQEPEVMTLTYTAANPLCYGGNDGSIALTVKGGTTPYAYHWLTHPLLGNNAEVSNLVKGLYHTVVTDANGCRIEQPITLVDPEQIQITTIKDTILCVGQEVTYHADNPGLSYQWRADNGFASTAASVQLSRAGAYSLTVSNAVGCSVTKHFHVNTSTTLLKADFLQSSFANVGDTILLIDVSKPTPSKTTWVLPTGATEIGSNATGTIRQVVYNSTGTYTTMMTVTLGECADAIQKTITILPKGQRTEVQDALGYQEALVKVFKLYPNPTTGSFKVAVELTKNEHIKVRLINFATNQLVELKEAENSKQYELSFNHPELLPGVHIVSLEVAGEIKTLKFIKL